MPFICAKCEYEHESYIKSEYSKCEQCGYFCCKECCDFCNKCNKTHCWRCNYYIWFCDIEEEYHCNGIESYKCFDCEDISCGKYIIKRKNGMLYCGNCNTNYCENCDEYIELNTFCYDCIKEIDNILSKKLPEELIKKILEFINF